MCAGVDDREMVDALSINVTLVFAGGFASGLAAFGGTSGGPTLERHPDQGSAVLMVTLILVVLGGWAPGRERSSGPSSSG